MAFIQSTPQQPGGMVSTAPKIVQPLPPGAFTAQAGYNGAAGAGMQPLVSALMKAKMQNLLQNKLPGTTPQSLGAGTAGADAATGPQSAPLSLGGAPPVAVA